MYYLQREHHAAGVPLRISQEHDVTKVTTVRDGNGGWGGNCGCVEALRLNP